MGRKRRFVGLSGASYKYPRKRTFGADLGAFHAFMGAETRKDKITRQPDKIKKEA